jgi:hypothetical protein
VLYKYVDPDDLITDAARRAGLIVAFVVIGRLLNPFSDSLSEVFFHPPGYLCGTRVLVGTVNYTKPSERYTDNTCVGAG